MTGLRNQRICAKPDLPHGRAFVWSPTRALPRRLGVQASQELMCPPELGPGAGAPKETAG